MDDEIFGSTKKENFSKYTPRDILTIAFRRRRLLIGCVVVTVLGTILGAWLLPRYKGEAKLIVMRQRVDPVLTPAPEEATFAVSAINQTPQKAITSPSNARALRASSRLSPTTSASS